jgi:hypothetical protein
MRGQKSADGIVYPIVKGKYERGISEIGAPRILL